MVVRGLLNYITQCKDTRSPVTNRIDLVEEAAKLDRGVLLLIDLYAVLPHLCDGSEHLYGGDLQLTLSRLTMFLTSLEHAKIRTSWFVEVPCTGLLDSFPYRHEEWLKEEKSAQEAISTSLKFAQGKVGAPSEHHIYSPLLAPILLSTLKSLGVTVHMCVGEQQPPLGPWDNEPVYVVTDNADFAVTRSCFMIPVALFDIEKAVAWGCIGGIPDRIIAEFTSPEILSKHFRLGHPPKEEWGKSISEQPHLRRKWWVEKCLTELCLIIGTESTGPVFDKLKLWKKCGISDGKSIESIARWFRDQVYTKKLLWRDVRIEQLHECLSHADLQFPVEYSRAVYSGSSRNLMRVYTAMSEWKLTQQELGIEVFLRAPRSTNTYQLVGEEAIMSLHGYVELIPLLEETPLCHGLTLPLREALYLLTGVTKVEENERHRKTEVNLESEPNMNFYSVLQLWTSEQKANFVLALCSTRIEKFNGIDVPNYFHQILMTNGDVEPSALNLAYVAAAYMATLNVEVDGVTGSIREHEFDTIILSLLLTFQAQSQPMYIQWKQRILNAWEASGKMSIAYRFSARGFTFMTWWQHVLRLCLGIYESLELGVTASSLLNIFNPAIFVTLYSAGAWEQWELPVPSDTRKQAFYDVSHWADSILQIRWELVQNSEFQVVKQQILSWLSARKYIPKFTEPETAAALGAAINEDALPIDSHRDRITEHIFHHRITCIQGETGCGKSTRVPVYILEHWQEGGKLPPKVLEKKLEHDNGANVSDKPVQYFRKPRIMVTQPRRIACVSLAKRVAEQLGEKNVGQSVGYQISGDSTASRNTEIVYVTTGYLLQVLVNDPSRLKEFTHLILDEVHERDVDSDLVNLVVKLQLTNFPFHLVIMSATLQGDLFGRYFCEGHHRVKPIYVGAKRFPVDIIYLEDILPRFGGIYDARNRFSTDAIRTIQRADRTFAPGGAKGWGAEEVESEKHQDRDDFASSGASDTESDVDAFVDMNVQLRKTKEKLRSKAPAMLQPGFDILVKEIVQKCATPAESILIFFPGIGEITEIHEVLMPLEDASESGVKICVFVLHSLIPKDEQELAVFSDPPPDTCHVILASNIAESSLTLPRVRVVIDFGLRRQLVYDARRHMSCLITCWVSQASAKQRMGRTGRVFEGTVIRLYSKYFYDSAMDEFDPPEMQTAPLEKLYVNVKVLSSRLPKFIVPGDKKERKLDPRELLSMTAQPPDTADLDRSICTLEEMGALTSNREDAVLTLLGHLMLALPIDIYLCRMIIYGALFGCAADAVLIASVLASQDPFTLPSHLVIKKPEEYADALYRSYKTRLEFDSMLLSEPLMLRNMFVTWLTKFNENKKPARNNRSWQTRETPRASYLRFSQQFAREGGAAIVPKRCVHLCSTVLDTATRFRKFLVDDTKAAKDIDRLLDMLSLRFYAHQRGEPELFASDAGTLRVLMVSSFAPNFMIGSTKLRGSAPTEPSGKKQKKAPKVEPNKMEALFDELANLGMDPLNSVCVPLEIPRWFRRTTERLVTDLTATLEMMLSIGEGSLNPNQYVYVILENDWKKMFVEVKTKEITEGEREKQRVEMEEAKEKKRREKKERTQRRIAQYQARKEALADADAEELGDYPVDSSDDDAGTSSAPKGRIDYQSVATSLHLFDQFGAGRFKFLVNLIDTQWKEKQDEMIRVEMERREQERAERERLRRDAEMRAWFQSLSGDIYYLLCDALRTEIPVDAQTGELDAEKLGKVVAEVGHVAKTSGCKEVWTSENIPLMRKLLEERTVGECEKWFMSCRGETYERLCAALRCTDAESQVRIAEVVKSSGCREIFGVQLVPKLRKMRADRVEEQLRRWVAALEGEHYENLVNGLAGEDEQAVSTMREVAHATSCHEVFEPAHLPRLRQLQRERVARACKKWICSMTTAIYERLIVALRQQDCDAEAQVAAIASEVKFCEAAGKELLLLRDLTRERLESECKKWFVSLGEHARRRVSLLLKSEDSYKEELEEETTEEVETQKEIEERREVNEADNVADDAAREGAPQTRIEVTRRMVTTLKTVPIKRRVTKHRDDLLLMIASETRAPPAFYLADLPLLREIHLEKWLDILHAASIAEVNHALEMADDVAWKTIRRLYPGISMLQIQLLRKMKAEKEQRAALEVSRFSTPCPSSALPSASPLPSTPIQPSPNLLTPRVETEYGEDYGLEATVHESELGEGLAITMYRPVSPCEVNWDVFSPPQENDLREKVAKHASTKKKKIGPKISKGRCNWRNVMGYLCSTTGSQARSGLNELCAVFTSQQGSEQGGGVIWVDGVTVIPDAQIFIALILSFTPHMYSFNLHVNASTGLLTQLCIGDVPCDPRGLKVDDIQRISDLRLAVSGAYLGSIPRKKGEVTEGGASTSQPNGPEPSQTTPRTQAALQEHTHRVDIELDAEPMLGDAPEVRTALATMLDNLGTGSIPFAPLKPQDTIIQQNIQQQSAGSFCILRPLHDLVGERNRRIAEYAERQRKQEEEKRRKEEERRRGEAEKRRKRDEDKRRKQEDHRSRQQLEQQQRQQRKQGVKKGADAQEWNQGSYASNWNSGSNQAHGKEQDWQERANWKTKKGKSKKAEVLDELPVNWQKVWSQQEHKFYFWDTTTNKTQWETPTAKGSSGSKGSGREAASGSGENRSHRQARLADQVTQRAQKLQKGSAVSQRENDGTSPTQEDDTRHRQYEMQRLAHLRQMTPQSMPSGEQEQFYPSTVDQQYAQQMAMMQQMHWQQQSFGSQGAYNFGPQQFMNPPW